MRSSGSESWERSALRARSGKDKEWMMMVFMSASYPISGNLETLEISLSVQEDADGNEECGEGEEEAEGK